MAINKILILGSGAREHALSWKLKNEIGKDRVFVAPGNAGTALCSTNLEAGVTDFKQLGEYCLQHKIDFVLPGSEAAIDAGVRDYFESTAGLEHIYVFSPDKEAGQLESSKAFAKEFMARHEVPTAAYGKFTADNLEEGYQFLDQLKPPYVLKADGLAAGKGVLIIRSLSEAKNALKEMVVNKQFGEASSTVVIEEFLDGLEFSVFVMTDGYDYILLPEAKDYKRIGEGDTGLNTGGMGAVSPVPFFYGEMMDRTIKEVIEPTIKGLGVDQLQYRGFVFFGLIEEDGNPKVIEYNVRMGDPETEVVIPRLDESLYDILSEIKEDAIKTRIAKCTSNYCTTVFTVSGGYPEKYEKGKHISLNQDSETLFHAGTKEVEGKLVTNGGRVLAGSAFGSTLKEALNNSYSMVNKISFEGKTIRRDIGKDLQSASFASRIGSYLLFKKNKGGGKYVKQMHTINKISIFLFLAAVLLMLSKCMR